MYETFLQSKIQRHRSQGFTVDQRILNELLFLFQKRIVGWILEKGKAAVFADCGLGKGPMSLAWSQQIVHHTAGSALILAPLAVSEQFVREGNKFGIPVNIVTKQSEVVDRSINVTNYEKMHHFDLSSFAGLVLDESSIMKSFTSATTNKLLELTAKVPYKLACTATPAPNDYMELGTHAEYLGVLSRTEMLSTFFVHDGGETAKWRLKGHAEKEFWKWVSSWAICIRKPSDLGYSDDGFALPALNLFEHTIESKPKEGQLFAIEAQTLNERRDARRESLEERVADCAKLVNESPEPWIVWCDFNAEGDLLEKSIPGSVQVAGNDTDKHKVDAILDFISGKTRVLISKPSIFGWGLNLQHCRNQAFVGLSDSYESFYQAVRRSYRFGQTQEVDIHLFISTAEGAVLSNIKRKHADLERLTAGMVEHIELNSTARNEVVLVDTRRDVAIGEKFTMHLGDCVDVVKTIPDNSIHYSIYSPPFASLYTYSASERDMGNCTTDEEFAAHFGHLIPELYRVLMPGRLMSFHCMNLPRSKERDGYIGIWDFRGELTRMFINAGFIYHSEVVIWKDPVTAMQRTKAIGLLHKQLKKDSCISRQGIPDYLVTMRKPGDNPERVIHTNESFPVDVWQNYASPVWMDINPSNTLQRDSAREEADERHVCPLQLEVIERALRLWTNPGDTVLSPFAGIGSEGFVALKEKRRFIGAELKESYWKQAVSNLQAAEQSSGQRTIFDMLDQQEVEAVCEEA